MDVSNGDSIEFDSLLAMDSRSTLPDGGLLLELPLDLLFRVLKLLKPEEVDDLRAICRALKNTVDANRCKLPQHECKIGIHSYDREKIKMELYKNSPYKARELPFTSLPQLIDALTESSNGPFYPLLNPSRVLRGILIASDDVSESLDADLSALDNILPPSTAINLRGIALGDVSFATMKAMVAKRVVGIFSCGLPRWNRTLNLDGARPVSSKALKVVLRKDQIFSSDNLHTLRAILTLSTKVSISFSTGGWNAVDQDQLFAHVAATAESLVVSGSSDSILPLLGGVARITCYDSTRLSTSGIRGLVEAYLEHGREAKAWIVIDGDQRAAFSPLASGFVGNKRKTADEQRNRRDCCLTGDNFTFKNLGTIVQVVCRYKVTVKRNDFHFSLTALFVYYSRSSSPMPLSTPPLEKAWMVFQYMRDRLDRIKHVRGQFELLVRFDETTFHLWGLYQQATKGDLKEKKNGYMDPAEKSWMWSWIKGNAKWHAWNDCRGTPAKYSMTSVEASSKFIDGVQDIAGRLESLVDEWRNDADPRVPDKNVIGESDEEQRRLTKEREEAIEERRKRDAWMQHSLGI